MSPDEWCNDDSFHLQLFSSMNPMDQGFEGLEKVLEGIESLNPELRLDTMSHFGRRPKYSRQALRKRLQESYIGDTFTLMLVRSQPPEVIVSLASRTNEEGVFCSLLM